MLPLYENNAAPRTRSHDAHAGLWFERFFDRYDKRTQEIADGEKLSWLQNFNHKEAGNTDALQDAAFRQMDLVKRLNGRHKFFNTQWHFVTGTGYPHPVENGLLWHPVHGVPYLSGSAVKGLVRAWVEQWAELDETAKPERLFSWFGSEEKGSKKTQTGDLIFFDALPVKAVKLVADIMTPHCGAWYSDGGKIEDVAREPEKVPADWHDPVPIPFLVVDKSSSYLFSIAPRNDEAAKRVDMDEVIECLTNALEWLGAGAKTATGYGQMQCDKQMHDEMADKLKQIQKQRDLKDKIKNLTPLAQEYFTQMVKQDWQGDKDAFWHVGRIEQWLDKLEQEPNSEIISSIKALMDKHFAGLLANPEKAHGKKDRPVYSDRQRQIAHRLNKS